MKKLVFLLFLGVSPAVWAQPPIKLFAYSQVFTPGMIRARDENGNEPARQVNTTYYVFVRVPASVTIKINKVWINSRAASFAWLKTDSTPVINESPSVTGGFNRTVMVPKTNQPVYRIDVQSVGDAPDPAAHRYAKTNSLVITYAYKGRLYTAVLKKIAEMEPVNGM